MSCIRVTRSVTIPDPLRIARYKRAPELGPRVLFFSGGSALRPLSRKLIDYTHNSIHLITPFDSGGSSAVIRKAFNILSVGDLRYRLMALADQSMHGNPEVYNLFAFRLPPKARNRELAERLRKMANSQDPLVARIPNPLRRIIRNHLHHFLEIMPEDFDLRGASIGNLVLTGGYFNNRKHIEPVIYMFSKLIEARGVVRPITGLSFHLAAELENGETLVGQHILTGREAPLPAAIKKLYITKSLQSTEPVKVAVKAKIRNLIESADLICYPMGSFYTSVVANLLPEGVCEAIASNPCPKIYIPNVIGDPELFGTSLWQSVQTLVGYLQKPFEVPRPPDQLLNFILLDTRSGKYQNPIHLKKIRQMGIQVIDADLITETSRPFQDEVRLIELLLSMT